MWTALGQRNKLRLGTDNHLNNGLSKCASQLFQQELVGWFDHDVSGVTAVSPECLDN